MGTHARLCYTLILMSWPAVSLTVSIVFLKTSLMMACYASGVWWLQFLVTVEIMTWVWLLPLSVWCALKKTLPPNVRHDLKSKRANIPTVP
ncbi:uncharacterized protein EDB91DRAFT_1339622 [Suillus paluster]|uniref:uncharacterized protein n=1 Tax=Suillus paluster TaxID=48578 RepID=UPI001B875B4C|nr:uncharacterized protein EDB91DRAFT_1339622 [Suillus paluster]KAG1726497.1 hypothetical protein EDB91DRAFT_1339622 [Suillus paluster]